MSKLKLSIITVLYNSEIYIKDFLISVDKFLPDNAEIILFDNSSSDQTVKLVEEIAHKISSRRINLIKNNKNIGFSKGCNLAVKQAHGELLFFLNPDTKIIKGSFESFVRYLEDNDNIGILVPRLVEPSGNIQRSVQRFPTIKGAILEFFLGKKNAYMPFYPDQKNPTNVECAVGGAMLIKKELYDSVCGFDEKYFMYYEDYDLCRKIKTKYKNVMYYPDLVIGHDVGGSKVENKKLPLGLRTISHFYPIKETGKYSYIVKSRYIYHGVINGLIIALIIYFGNKFHK